MTPSALASLKTNAASTDLRQHVLGETLEILRWISATEYLQRDHEAANAHFLIALHIA